MPLPLKILYWGSCVASAVGWVLAVAVGRGSGGVPALLLVPVLLLPLVATFALGFREQQTWTRPLVVAVLALPIGVCWLIVGNSVLFLLVLPLGAATYLYRSPACRDYYRALREQASIRLSGSDFADPSFVPVYTAGAAALLGAGLGCWAVVRHLGYSSGLGANDATGLVLGIALGAIVFGVAGFWCGEAVISMRQRAAQHRRCSSRAPDGGD